MNTSAILLIPVLHGLNGHSNNSARKETIILNKTPVAKSTFVTPKKHRCVFWIKPLRTVVAQCWCSSLWSEMKETNNISHRAAIMATLKWKSGRKPAWSTSLFLSFLQILFEKVLTDADEASVQLRRCLKALFWCLIQTYSIFVFDLFNKIYIMRETVHTQRRSHSKSSGNFRH